MKLANLVQDASKPQSRSAKQGLLGRIASINYSPNFDEGVFTGHLLNERDKIYPQSVTMDITFHVWHTHNLGYSITRSARSGFSRFPYARGKIYAASAGGSAAPAGDPHDPNDPAEGSNVGAPGEFVGPPQPGDALPGDETGTTVAATPSAAEVVKTGEGTGTDANDPEAAAKKEAAAAEAKKKKEDIYDDYPGF